MYENSHSHIWFISVCGPWDSGKSQLCGTKAVHQPWAGTDCDTATAGTWDSEKFRNVCG